MKYFLFAGLFPLVLTAGLSSVRAADLAGATRCLPGRCVESYSMPSGSDRTAYGLLLRAPKAGCGRVRYRVEDVAAEFLGHTPPLRPGEWAVVRVGRGFAVGQTVLRVTAVGCDMPPLSARRVRLGRRSPDHGRAVDLVAVRSE